MKPLNPTVGTEGEEGDRPGVRPGTDKDHYPDDRYNTNNNNNNNRPYDRYPPSGKTHYSICNI